MDYCPFVKRQGVKIRGRPSKSVLSRFRRCLTNGWADAFTLIELIIMVSIIGILCGIAAPIYSDFSYRAQVEVAKAIIREIESGVNIYNYRYGTYPATLSDAMIATPVDPWGKPYQYASSADPNWLSLRRRDGRMVPLNSDFDLYSMGRDGRTVKNLGAPDSADDVVRARNGAFVDLGEYY
jgi:general secretion pathway protein G